MTALYVVLGIVALLLLWVAVSYNRFVRQRNLVQESWRQIDVELRRRYDLIPNLVETVKGYATHEQATFEEVTKARAAAQQAQGVQETAQAENALTGAIGRLFAVAEQYPQLRATENFQQLQAELSDTENKIAVARQVYNDTVNTYENARETLPTSLFAGIFGFEEKQFFEVEDAARAPVQVKF
jgi:LemA protein